MHNIMMLAGRRLARGAIGMMLPPRLPPATDRLSSFTNQVIYWSRVGLLTGASGSLVVRQVTHALVGRLDERLMMPQAPHRQGPARVHDGAERLDGLPTLSGAYPRRYVRDEALAAAWHAVTAVGDTAMAAALGALGGCLAGILAGGYCAATFRDG